MKFKRPEGGMRKQQNPPVQLVLNLGGFFSDQPLHIPSPGQQCHSIQSDLTI
jgi:hypothetical protein